MMNKVLLTGHSGFLGRRIKSSLLKSGYHVTSLGRSIDSDIICDLSVEIFDFGEFDIVVHAAAKAHIVPKNAIEKKDFFTVNFVGTKKLLYSLENSNVRSFVFISTVAVYGINSGKNIDENSLLLANDPYGLSKIQAEQVVLDWCKKNNVICTILRLPLLFGENPPGNLGAMIMGIKKGYYFNIGGGLAKKSMVLVEDVADILVKVSQIGGIYNLTDGYHPNFLELSSAIAKQNGKSKSFNMPYIIAKSIALFGDVVGSKFPLNSNKLKKITSNLTFDDTKAREVLGWQPRKVIDWLNK